MLSDHISAQIKENFPFEPTDDQNALIDSLARYLTEGESYSLFLVNGYAGTGKTTVISALVRALNNMKIKTVLMAPTGRAAKVMSQSCGHPAYTIHKRIYRQKVVGAEDAEFSLNFNKDNNTIFIVDEGSMLSNYGSDSFGSGRLIDDLVEYVNNGTANRLIIVGDDAQLPPVGLDYSPALNPDYMKGYGEVHYSTLAEVMRQSYESGILVNATSVRTDLMDGVVDEPKFDLSIDDFHSITGAELIEEIEQSYAKYGRDDTIIITRSNKRANQYNQGIRRTILYHEDEINSGDMLMIVRNNYYWVDKKQNPDFEFIANGDVAIVRRLQKTTEMYGFRFGYMTLEFPDYDGFTIDCWVMLDTLYSDAPALTSEENSQLFRAVEEDYMNIGNKRNRYKKIMENEFFNALQVKFAYAVTCHKSQGGEWSSVFVDQLLFGEEQMTREFQRWLYTALTRAQKKLYLVNWDRRFFE